MTLYRREVKDTRTQLRVEEVICDRCGEKARRVAWVFENYPFEGAYISGKFFPKSGNASETERFELELCGQCSRKLQKWVGKPSSEQPIVETVREPWFDTKKDAR